MVKKQKHKRSYKIVVWIGLSIGVVVILFLLLGWVMRNGSLYEGDKELVGSDARTIIDSLDFNGTDVYYNFDDIGCESNTVGLQVSFGCGFSGRRYYSYDGDLAHSLHELDQQIQAKGWRRALFTGQSESEFEEVLAAKTNKLISYISPKYSQTRLYVVFYKSKSFANNTDIEQSIKNRVLEEPKPGNFIYGVKVGATYYYCANESFFKQPCPDPPSEPR